MSGFVDINHLVLFALLLIATIADVKYGIIPDAVVGVGLLYCVMVMGLDASMLCGFVAGGAPLFVVILVTRGGMGAGDMKLLAMIGAFVGVQSVLAVLLLAVVSCGLFAAVLLLCKLTTLQSKLVFGPFIAGATVVAVVFQTQLAHAFDWYMNWL